MIKTKLFIVDIKKEESWINEQILQGYHLIDVSAYPGRYEFEKCANQKSDCTVRIDFRIFKNKYEFADYITLFEDSGWHHIKGTKSSGRQYFEKIRMDADPEIFSDNISKADRYRRISDYWLGLFAAYIPLLIVFQSTGMFDINKMLHPKALYYTPGLWEMSGARFWRAFLFETPFALGRGFIGILFLAIILSYAYFGLKTLYWYYKEKKQINKTC